MTLTGPARVSRLAKLMIGISLATFDLGFKTSVRAYLVGREPVMRIANRCFPGRNIDSKDLIS